MLILAGYPDLDGHETGPGHPERRARAKAAIAGIEAAGLDDAVVHLEPRRATRSELERVHGAAYLDSLERFCIRGGGHIDADTVASPGSWETALLAAGGVLATIEALESGLGDVGFVAARPPGHHAMPATAMGFCLINNVAVGAAALVEAGNKVLIVDWDVHHGNGTQAAFWDDPRVLYVSTHQAPWYPGTGLVEETGGPGAPGHTINVELPAGATGDVLRLAFDELIAPAAQEFSPDWVIVSAGFDAHRDDPLAMVCLSAGDFADMARATAELAPGPGRLVLALEGGYDLGALTSSVGATLAALCETGYRPEPPTAGGPGRQSVARAQEAHRRAIEDKNRL